MDSQLNNHLTDEQFSGLLFGINPPLVRDHLAACAQCAEEADRVAGAIGSFEQQSRLWAERRAASLPSPSYRHPSLAWLRRPQAWTAAAAALALAVGISVSVHHNHRQAAQQQIAAAQQGPTDAQLKADNELLAEIDVELRSDTSTSARMYGLNGTSRGVHTRAKRITNE